MKWCDKLLDARGAHTADENWMNPNETGDIVSYQAEDGSTNWSAIWEGECLADAWSAWSAVCRDKSTVSRHLKNIFVEEELERDSVAAKIAPTAADGKIYMVDHYNLVAVISLAV